MKVIKQIFSILIFLAGSTNIVIACGGVFYACGKTDVLEHGTDFWNNCNHGDRIRVVDVCHPAETAYTFCLQDGPCNERP
jgi:hypothetical protein